MRSPCNIKRSNNNSLHIILDFLTVQNDKGCQFLHLLIKIDRTGSQAQTQHDWISFRFFSCRGNIVSLREIKHLSGRLTVHTEAFSSFIKTGFYVFTLITLLGIGIPFGVCCPFHSDTHIDTEMKRAVFPDFN